MKNINSLDIVKKGKVNIEFNIKKLLAKVNWKSPDFSIK
jgi:hypothetical protein